MSKRCFCWRCRLNHGKLPTGYYVANGTTCRLHIATVARERAWPGNWMVRDRELSKRHPDPEDLEVVVCNIKRSLIACLHLLESEWDDLWAAPELL